VKASNVDAVAHAADLISQADALVIAAGAGMGVDSGLPDFRGNTGFWKAYPALAKAGLEFTRVASPRTFETDPELAWGFYGHRLALYRDTVPHAGFVILKRWAEAMPLGSFVFTSNVDGQFQKAGFAESEVFECHGSIHWLQCTRPCGDDVWPSGAFTPVVDEDACRLRSDLPQCPHCGALARPNILMFGDSAWCERRATVQESRLGRWISRARRPVVVELGAGSYIASVRHFSERVIHDHRGRLVRINPRESRVPTSLDVGLAAGALECLQAVDAAMARD
jgi:NAD-dependent SIR2 family protein deacetylase